MAVGARVCVGAGLVGVGGAAVGGSAVADGVAVGDAVEEGAGNAAAVGFDSGWAQARNRTAPSNASIGQVFTALSSTN